MILVAVSIYLMRGYTDKKHTSMFIRVTVVIMWWLSFSPIIFIPLDIYLNELEKEFPDDD